MGYKRKSWQEKLHVGQQIKVETVEGKFADIPAGATMLIATPAIVDDYIRHIPLGHHTSLQQMRKDLAAQYHADYTCPISSGIFLRIVSEAAYEQYLSGKPLEEISPFWRMIDSKAPITKKLSFGTDFVRQQRQLENLAF